ncbi:sporulation histidine kinase inhibitor Sda [Paenibacillus sp. YN15]|uniref:sporulation histidine kinase inhibitor Sda n=1 Tax=Paenibacillus sp. YN15 TaxID=1742774 RepID=UPI000DCE11AB|nr:sporulation histidine kinase inhibitor Sda [Paenibacillus sp. YN15]RAV02709.1 hypothetical protein DQG13_09410 [Paenibacillus sp. YN15]
MADYQLLSDEVLLSAFQKAVELKLEADFIELLRKELIRRGMMEKPNSIGGDLHDPQG